ncbi:MAG: glycosyltransferase family 39 protein [Acidobacteriota bacterium]
MARGLPGAPPLVVLSAVSLVLLWWAVAGFWTLSAVQRFDRAGAVLWVLLLALVGWRWGRGGQRLRWRSLFERLRALPEGWLWCGVLAVASLRLLRSLAAPPLAWDALTYHLYKAGRFVQTGGWAREPAPDTGGAYEYLSPLVESLYAWSLLPTHRDGLVPLVGFAFWGLGQVALYGTARELGAGRRGSLLASAAVAASPAALTYLGSAYVDLAGLAFFALGALFFCRWRRTRRSLDGVLTVAALGLGAGAKLTLVPAVAVLAVSFLFTARSLTGRGKLLALGAVGVAVPPYLRSWLETGSPIFPVGLEIFGWSGHPLAAPEALAGVVDTLAGPFATAALLLFAPLGGAFNGPGPALVILPLLAIVAFAGSGRRLERGVFALVAVVSLALFLSPAMVLIRTTTMAATTGRYFLPGLAALAILAAGFRGPWARALAWLAVIGGAWLARPRAWSASEAVPLAVVLALAVVAIAVVAGVRRGLALGWLGTRVAIVSAALLIGLGTAALEQVRQGHRYEIYRAAAERPPLFHLHRLHGAYAGAWPLWQALDGPRPLRLAVTAGWDRLGHNWYRYPLLGSRLQNQVFYVPITAAGEVVDYRDETAIAERADRQAWLRRLRAERIDAVVSLAPRWTVEDQWLRAAPQLFRRVAGDERNFHAAFGVDSVALEAALAGAGEALPASP